MANLNSKDATHRRLLAGMLDFIERFGNRLPDPITIFICLAGLALVGSWIAASAGAHVTHPVTHETIQAVNLLDATGIRRVLTEAVTNFTGFAPLGTVLVAMIGIGVAERTGLFAAALKALVTAVPPWAITPTVIFAGIMSNVAADAGFVILPPLAAMLYASLGRHPIAGVAAVFAGVGGGFSANLLVTSLDPLLSGITQEAAQVFDPAYRVEATASYYFMAASVVVLTAVGTWVSVRIVEPRMGTWEGDGEPVSLERIKPTEKRGLIAAGVALLLMVLVVLALVVPGDGLLRDPETGGLKPFYDSIVTLLALVFFVPGLAFGLVAGKVHSDRQAAKMMSDTMATMGSYIVMAFFAGQFIAYFGWSKLGIILAISGANLLESIALTGVPLLIAFVFVAALINLVMASSSAKWAIMAPVFVPMLMVLGWSPQVTQGLYRVGDSITNVITPLNYYLPIIIAVAQRYDRKAGLGTLVAAMLPYSVAFGILWTVMIVAWVSFGIPVGPGAPLHYPGG